METNKVANKIEGFGLAGYFALILGLIVSTETWDIRYLALGLILFAILYFGTIAFIHIVMIVREKTLLGNVLLLITLAMVMFLLIVVLLYGVALFQWHYDDNRLLDLLNNSANHLIKKLAL